MTGAAFPPLRMLTSRTVVLEHEDIDTDQIVPARFMATTDRSGMANALFHDWRFGQKMPAGGHLLDRIDPVAHRILVAGRNFGCGSSREHAAWALFDFGIRVVVSSSFADIFTANAFRNGILTVEVRHPVLKRLIAHPGAEVIINLKAGTLGSNCLSAIERFSVDPFSRACLLEGRDPLEWLLSATEGTNAYLERINRPWANLAELNS